MSRRARGRARVCAGCWMMIKGRRGGVADERGIAQRVETLPCSAGQYSPSTAVSRNVFLHTWLWYSESPVSPMLL